MGEEEARTISIDGIGSKPDVLPYFGLTTSITCNQGYAFMQEEYFGLGESESPDPDLFYYHLRESTASINVPVSSRVNLCLF